MAKIRCVSILDPDLTYLAAINHLFVDDPYEPTAYHTAFAYDFYDVPIGITAWQGYKDIPITPPDVITAQSQAILKAKSWCSLPVMVRDICIWCRYFDYGPSISRWNIYRGPDLPRFPWVPGQIPNLLVPVFYQHAYDPPPPGYGT